MKQNKQARNRKKGFTLIELMLVIAVMAILAGLAIGGAIKVLKNARLKRIESMCISLRMALVNYQGQTGSWPVSIPFAPGQNTYTFRGEENQKVFAPLLEQTGYLVTSEYLTKVQGLGVVSLQKALERGRSSVPLGYANPNDQRKFHFFDVEFNLLTDSVIVKRGNES